MSTPDARAEAGPEVGGIAAEHYYEIHDGEVIHGVHGWYVAPLNGSRGWEVSRPKPVRSLAWSPDGSQVAFAMDGLWTAEATGELARRLTRDAGDVLPAWSPGGGTIVFARDVVRDRNESRRQLYVVDTVGGSVRPLFAADTGFDDSSPSFSPDGTLYFSRATPERTTCAPCPVDIFRTQPLPVGSTAVLAIEDAAVPAVSPTGTRIVFSDAAQTSESYGQLVVADLDGSDRRVVTKSGWGPAWSADAREIAFFRDTGSFDASVYIYSLDRDTVRLFRGSGPDQGPERVAWQRVGTDLLTRVSGSDRVGTAVAVSRALFTAGSVSHVVLARADAFPDAVVGAPLANALDGPLLLTPSGGLAAAVVHELGRVLAPGGTVHVLGGTGALSAEVELSVRELGFGTERVAGADRYETAVAVAERIASPDAVLLATGHDFPDAAVAGAAGAGGLGRAPVLLTDGSRVPPGAVTYLAARPETRRFAVGGPAGAAAAAAGVQARVVSGPDRYATSVAMAEEVFASQPRSAVVVARGDDFPDTLPGGVLAGRGGGVLLLTPSPEWIEDARLGAAASTFVHQQSGALSRAWVLGGTGAVTETALGQLAAALAPRTHVTTNPVR